MAKALLLAAVHATGGPNVRFTAEELTTMSAFVKDGNIMLF